MEITRDQIEDIVKHGLVADIFRMERSYSLLKIIGVNAEVINAQGAGNFGELFGALQSALQTDAVLAVARLYDTPNKKYPIRCIRGLLKFLEEHKGNLPKIREQDDLEKELNRIGMNQSEITLASTDEAAFAIALSKHFSSVLEDAKTIDTIGKLKSIRDKAIAHNEQVSRIEGPTWQGLEELMQHAKDLVGVLGWSYLNTVYVHDGEYIMTRDAKRSSRAMNRLQKMVIPNILNQKDAAPNNLSDT